ncbi:MAG: hypothetical protein NC388_05980 [Clostridium sp.]|nr:hypothetical protein [Clostridium sp.]
MRQQTMRKHAAVPGAEARKVKQRCCGTEPPQRRLKNAICRTHRTSGKRRHPDGTDTHISPEMAAQAAPTKLKDIPATPRGGQAPPVAGIF